MQCNEKHSKYVFNMRLSSQCWTIPHCPLNRHQATSRLDQVRCLASVCSNITWHQYCDGRLHGFADDVVQSEHPVRLDVVVPQHFVHLRTRKQKDKPLHSPELHLQ